MFQLIKTENNTLSENPILELFRNDVLSRSLIGKCPICGSKNTHDCQKKQFKEGSDCDFIFVVNEESIGHCEICNCLWCLKCKELIEVLNNPMDNVPNYVSKHLLYCRKANDFFY